MLLLVDAATVQGGGGTRVFGTPDDWSHHHVVFSDPDSFANAVKRGTFESWYRTVTNPRYLMQLRRRGDAPEVIPVSALGTSFFRGKRRHPPTLHRDWSMSVEASSSVGNAMYPAKYTFDVTKPPDCVNDYVAFNTSVTPAMKTASATGTFMGNPTNGQTATITNGANSEILTASGAPATGTVTITSVPNSGDTVTIGSTTYKFVTTLVNPNDVLIVSGSTSNSAASLRAAISANAGQCSPVSPCFGTGTVANASVTATRSTNIVTVTAITWGSSGNTIAFSTSNATAITLSPNTGTLSGGIDGSNTGTNFALDGNNTHAATNLAAAINRNNTNIGVTATSGGSAVTVTATTSGTAGNSIALAKTLSNFSWSGNSLSGGTDPQPSIIAYNELYSTQGSAGGYCSRNGPSVTWSYNTNPSGDTTGKNVTSPALSADGTKVAYVETRTNGNGGSILHVLLWKAGQGTLTSPVAPDQIVASWGSCPSLTSCVVNITFGNAQPDNNSSPFYNFSNDTLYVGDDNGVLHKFTPVFTGTPAEVTTGGWPITVNTGHALTGPVFDSGSGNIFVGDASGRLSYVREVGSTQGACSSGSPPCLGSSNQALGGTLVDAPMVDSSNGTVFVFDGQTGASNNVAEVLQTNTALAAIANVTFPNSGSSGVANMHAGTFDNAYYSATSGSGAGKLYVCAQSTGFRDHPNLFRIGFTAGTGTNAGISVMNSSADTGSLELASTSGEDCSPITEINNTAASTEWIFFSVGNNSSVPTGSACASGAAGCVLALNLTNLGATWPPAANGAYLTGFRTPAGPTYTSVGDGTINAAGTSGIVVDNIADTTLYPQASSIYFAFTGNTVTGATCNSVTGVGCAVKLTQSGLN